jgi:hypothetical protein
MSVTTERKSRAVETEFTRDIMIGKYRITGVPHLSLSRPTPNGENVIRNASVDLKLARIYEYMKTEKILSVDYSSF